MISDTVHWLSEPVAIWIGFATFAVGSILGGLLMYRWGRRPSLGRVPPRDVREYELERLVHAAAGVIRHLGAADILSDRSAQNAARWLDTYERFKWTRRTIKKQEKGSEQ